MAAGPCRGEGPTSGSHLAHRQVAGCAEAAGKGTGFLVGVTGAGVGVNGPQWEGWRTQQLSLPFAALGPPGHDRDQVAGNSHPS